MTDGTKWAPGTACTLTLFITVIYVQSVWTDWTYYEDGPVLTPTEVSPPFVLGVVHTQSV